MHLTPNCHFPAWSPLKHGSRCAMRALLVVALFAIASPVLAQDNFCWRDTSGRGVGEPLSTCADGLEKGGLLCYPACEEGFNGVGPVCWSNCPAGYVDDGATCRMPGDIVAKASYGRGAGEGMICGPGKEQRAGLCYASCGSGWRGEATVCYQDCPNGYSDDGLYCGKPQPYGRGAGYPAWDMGRCEADHGQDGCEWHGAIIYPKCAAGFHATGCCVCSPDCPAGWEDIGVSCKKPARNRGVGTVVDSCPAGSERDGALCYPGCREGFNGVGPMCWGQCPAGYVDDGATCRKDPIIVAKESRTRGAGLAMVCADGLEQSGALCYPPCGARSSGIGPVCWGECPSSMPFNCGAACAVSEGDCIHSIQQMLIQGAKMMVDVVTFGGSTALDVKAAMDKAAEATVQLASTAAASGATQSISAASKAGLQAAVEATLKSLLLPFEDVWDVFNPATYANVGGLAALMEEAARNVEGGDGLTGGHVLALMSTQMAPTERDALISQLALAIEDENVTDPFDVISMIPLTNPFGILDFVDTFRKGSCSEYPDDSSTGTGVQPVAFFAAGRDPNGFPVAAFDQDTIAPVQNYSGNTLGVLLTGDSKPSGRTVMKVAKDNFDRSRLEQVLGSQADPALLDEIAARFDSGRLFAAGSPTAVRSATGASTPATDTPPGSTAGEFRRIQNNWYQDRFIHNQNGTLEVGPIDAAWHGAEWKIVNVHSGWVRIQNRVDPDLYIHNQNGILEVGPIDFNWASAMWKLEPAGNGWDRIQNSWYRDRYIHNENGVLEVGPIQPNWASALWRVE